MGDYITAVAERATKEMQMSTEKLISEQKMLELKKAANATAAQINAENEAWVEQYRLFQRKQAESYALILHTLKDSAAPYEALFELMRQKALKEHNSTALTLSM